MTCYLNTWESVPAHRGSPACLCEWCGHMYLCMRGRVREQTRACVHASQLRCWKFTVVRFVDVALRAASILKNTIFHFVDVALRRPRF